MEEPATMSKASKKENKLHQQKVSSILKEMVQTVPPESYSIYQILEQLGKKGLYILCMVLTVPFLLPFSIPGTSIPFGIIIALLGLSLLLNKKPWLPKKLKNYKVKRHHLIVILERGSHLFARIEKWTGPRLFFLTSNSSMRVMNGVFMILSAILLTLPLPLPLSNALPAYGVLFLSTGSLEKDGFLILLGYLMIFLSILYLTIVTLIGIKGVKVIIHNLF